MPHAARRHRRVALALAAAALALSLGAGAAVATAPSSFAVGGVPQLRAGSTPLGGLASATPLSLDVVLAPRDPAGLAALASAVSTPGSSEYHRYLSVAQFAARFGAAPETVATVEADLRATGLTPGALAPNGLTIRVSGDAAGASRAFAVSLRRWREPGGQTVFANTTDPRLPPALQGAVTAVLGLDDVPAAAPAGLIRARAVLHAPRALASQSADAVPAPCFTPGGPPYAINQVADAYGFGGLYSSGDLGAGVTVALYELEPYTPSDVAAFQSCFGTDAAVSNIAVDGGALPVTPIPAEQGLETVLDVENVIGIAPQSNIEVYQGPNTDAGVVDTLGQIVSDDTAEVISDSWGICEPTADPSVIAQEDTLLQEAALQGQTFLVASGDAGSDGCAPDSGQAVDDAASQPWATGVGGTTLSSLGPPPAQSAWSGSGGGVSSLWQMPSWQAGPGVIESMNSSGGPCAASAGSYCREVPDVSADANPNTGYIVYWSGWQAVGGTSAAAPVWAGLSALADASGEGGCATASLGFLNPSLYAIAAGTSHSSALADVTIGNNGAFPAGAGYDLVTGLGAPIAGGPSGLVAQLCAAATGVVTGATGSTNAPPVPFVTALSVSDALPGTVATISGGNFAAGASVSFGTLPASGVSVVNSSTLRVIVPAGTGVVDVRVRTGSGTSARNAADRYTYAPTATIGVPAPGAVYTQTQVVDAQFTCAASAPGSASCAAPVASGSPIDTSAVGAHQFTVIATDSHGVQNSATASYAVVSPPAVSISFPGAGATYGKGSTIAASYFCTASAPIVLAACTGTVAAGSAIDTSTAGAHTFTTTATDANGVSRQVSDTYRVVTAPTLGSVRQKSGRWLEHAAHGVNLPVGTSFAFTLNQSATVTLRFTRLVSGRLAGSACRTTARRGAKCTARVGAGSLSVTLGTGVHALPFAGATSSGRLAPGVYSVRIVASNPGGPSQARTVRFTIAQP